MIDTLNPTARGTEPSEFPDVDDEKANNVPTVDGKIRTVLVLKELEDIEAVIVDPLVLDDLLVDRVVGKNVPFSTVIE